MGKKFIDTVKFSERLRARGIRSEEKKLLVTNFHGTDQERDLTEPANCNGFGRIRHFRLHTDHGWPENPLPLEPALKALKLPSAEVLRAQVFQNAICNWRCWYCYVDFDLLSANPKFASFLTVSELVDLYLAEKDRPQVIDLSGGQPDLIPEWVPWMMRELEARGLAKKTYLWSDDNLSNDYFWQFLSDADHSLICNYHNYGKVCCFKGFNAESFSFNTGAPPDLFEQQFLLMEQQLALGIDIYCYTTFTGPSSKHVRDDMANFVDRLQELDPMLPLRTIPLKIKVFSPTKKRQGSIASLVLDSQESAIDIWNNELLGRFTSDHLKTRISAIPLRNRSVSAE